MSTQFSVSQAYGSFQNSCLLQNPDHEHAYQEGIKKSNGLTQRRISKPGLPHILFFETIAESFVAGDDAELVAYKRGRWVGRLIANWPEWIEAWLRPRDTTKRGATMQEIKSQLCNWHAEHAQLINLIDPKFFDYFKPDGDQQMETASQHAQAGEILTDAFLAGCLQKDYKGHPDHKASGDIAVRVQRTINRGEDV